MKRIALLTVLVGLALVAMPGAAFAADGAAANKFDLGGMALIAAAVAIGVAGAGCGLGQGKALAGACEGTARNPAAGPKIFTLALVGLAFIESIAIYAFVIAIMIMNEFPELPGLTE